MGRKTDAMHGLGDRTHRGVIVLAGKLLLGGLVLLALYVWAAPVAAPGPGDLRGGAGGPASPSPTLVRLAEADEALIRGRVQAMVQSLAANNPELSGFLEAVNGSDLAALPAGGGAVPRMTDAAFGLQTTDSVPGVEDVHAELRVYLERSLAGMTFDERVARTRQHLVTAAELNIRAEDDLADTRSIPTRIDYLNTLTEEVRLVWSIGCGCVCVGVGGGGGSGL